MNTPNALPAVGALDAPSDESQNAALASLSTASLLGALGLAAFFVLVTPGQPLAALLGIQSCLAG